jgi:hypothetical protein
VVCTYLSELDERKEAGNAFNRQGYRFEIRPHNIATSEVFEPVQYELEMLNFFGVIVKFA